MKGLNDDLHSTPEGGFVDVLLPAQQLRLNVAVLARQVAIEVRRDSGRHHLN